MRRKTLKFIDGQSGKKGIDFNLILDFVKTPKFLVGSVLVLLMLILGGLYLWYSHNYLNKQQIVTNSGALSGGVEYEWQQEAADSGLVADYLWSRTRELMLTGTNDETLIVSSYTLPGTLLSQEAAESGEYLLEDQALLLRCYLKDQNRAEAIELVNRVNELIDTDYALSSGSESGSESSEVKDAALIYGQMCWLDAYLDYYSMYGSQSDYSRITTLVEMLFDEGGMLLPGAIQVQTYDENVMVGASDDSLGDAQSQAAQGSTAQDFVAVPLEAVDLALIQTLEVNGFLPQGSFEKSLAIVQGARISDSLPLYAYAYYISDSGETIYLYAGCAALQSSDSALIDIESSVKTMRNLAEVDALPSDAYSWLKSQFMNSGRLYTTYHLIRGEMGEVELFEGYLLLMEIAVLEDDIDLYTRTVSALAGHVATRTSSPALSMIFRMVEEVVPADSSELPSDGTSDGASDVEMNYRNICYAYDNLMAYLLIE